MAGSIRKLARTLMAAVGGLEVDAAKLEGLIRFAVDERIREILDAAETGTGLEEAIDAEVDRRIGELGREHRLVAKDNHCGHQHQVVLLKGY